MAKVISYGTDKQAYFDLFMESCRRYNIDPIILGWGKKWVGYGKKLTDIRDYIKDFPDDEIIIAADPFDVVFLCPLDEIEKKFTDSKANFLSGAVKLGPVMRRVYNSEFNRTGKPIPLTPSMYNFANTGTWIARAGYAVRLIDRLVNEYGMTDTDMDQELITRVYIQDKTIADIDWECRIFHNLLFKNFITRKADLKDIEFRDGRIYNTATGTYPCILHASGNALMDTIALNLGYEKEKSVPFNNNINFLKKALFHINELSGIILIFILIAAAGIWGLVYLINHIHTS